MRSFRFTLLRTALLSGLYVALWRGLVLVLPDEPYVALGGWAGAYLIGLAWAVYLLERAARRIEARSVLADAHARPQVSVSGEVSPDRASGWNPLDPAARYYGRSGQRLRQSFAMLALYSLLFTAVYFLAHLQFASAAGEEEYELPAGGGNDSPQAMSVKVQKVVRKRYVINPYSSIAFAAPPPIDNVDVKLTDETANRYQVGMGDGGLGSGDGDGGGFGSGKDGGKIRFLRLRHSDKSWDKNFGIGGDRNLLAELVVRFPKMNGKVAEETEAIDIATLGNYKQKAAPPLIYVGGAGTFTPSAADKRVLKQYLTERHGMILGDTLGAGGFHGNFIAAMNEVTGTTAVVIPRDDTIHKRPFEIPQLPIVVAHGGTSPLGWKLDGRWAVYYHPGALSDAWRDDRAGIKKVIADQCYLLGINILSYAHREHDQWRRSQQP